MLRKRLCDNSLWLRLSAGSDVCVMVENFLKKPTNFLSRTLDTTFLPCL